MCATSHARRTHRKRINASQTIRCQQIRFHPPTCAALQPRSPGRALLENEPYERQADTLFLCFSQCSRSPKTAAWIKLR